MSTVSFSATKTVNPTEEVVVPTQETAIVQTPHETAIVVPEGIDNGVEGEITRGDIRLPRVNLVQKVGDLSNIFQSGSLVFNKEMVLSDGKTPVQVVVLRLKKFYQQEVPFDSGETALTFDTAKEVQAAGGTFSYGGDNYYSEAAHVMLAVQRPHEVTEELEPMFPFEHEDTAYGLAMLTLAKSAFNASGKTLITAAQSVLRAGLHTGRWNVTSELRTKGKNSWYVPVFKFAGKNNETDTAFFAGLKS